MAITEMDISGDDGYDDYDDDDDGYMMVMMVMVMMMMVVMIAASGSVGNGNGCNKTRPAVFASHTPRDCAQFNLIQLTEYNSVFCSCCYDTEAKRVYFKGTMYLTAREVWQKTRLFRGFVSPFLD